MECRECKKDFRSNVSLVAHIVAHHNKKDYYDKWIKSRVEGICLNCGNPTKFSGRWNRGYNKFCNNSCKSYYVANDPERIKRSNESTKKHYQEKFGVNYYTQTEEFKKKSKITKEKKYNDPNFSNLEKAKETCIHKYGVDNPAKAQAVKDKTVKTNMKRYGGPSHMHNKAIFDKVERNSFRSKLHSSGIYYRGLYEKDFLDTFSGCLKIENCNGIKYVFNKKKRVYYPDFYISKLNLIIEIKSSYLNKRDFEIINAKKKACIDAGFKFILIIDKNYKEFRDIFLSTPSICYG